MINLRLFVLILGLGFLIGCGQAAARPAKPPEVKEAWKFAMTPSTGGCQLDTGAGVITGELREELRSQGVNDFPLGAQMFSLLGKQGQEIVLLRVESERPLFSPYPTPQVDKFSQASFVGCLEVQIRSTDGLFYFIINPQGAFSRRSAVANAQLFPWKDPPNVTRFVVSSEGIEKVKI